MTGDERQIKKENLSTTYVQRQQQPQWANTAKRKTKHRTTTKERAKRQHQHTKIKTNTHKQRTAYTKNTRNHRLTKDRRH